MGRPEISRLLENRSSWITPCHTNSLDQQISHVFFLLINKKLRKFTATVLSIKIQIQQSAEYIFFALWSDEIPDSHSSERLL